MIMHTHVLETTYIEEEKKHVQVEMIVSSGIDVQASGVNGYSNYFGQRYVGEGLKESMYDFGHLLARIIYYAKVIKTRGIFMFLFLPRKEKINWRILLIRELFSLKDIGWGPPAQGHKSATHAPEIVVFVFLNTRSSQFSLCLGVIFFLSTYMCLLSKLVRTSDYYIKSIETSVKCRLFLYEIDTICFSG